MTAASHNHCQHDDVPDLELVNPPSTRDQMAEMKAAIASGALSERQAFLDALSAHEQLHPRFDYVWTVDERTAMDVVGHAHLWVATGDDRSIRVEPTYYAVSAGSRTILLIRRAGS